MHEIEPFYKWRDHYTAETDDKSPFYEREYNEFAYDRTVYNFYVHPQWDDIESETLLIKLLFVNYEERFAIIELFGEWNDTINNDIMLLRRNVIEVLQQEGITKFLLIGEHIFNFHGDTDDYYQEWFEETTEDDGWVVGINFREFVIEEMAQYNIPQYIHMRSPFNNVKWRPYKPELLIEKIDTLFNNWLDEGMKLLDS